MKRTAFFFISICHGDGREEFGGNWCFPLCAEKLFMHKNENFDSKSDFFIFYTTFNSFMTKTCYHGKFGQWQAPGWRDIFLLKVENVAVSKFWVEICGGIPRTKVEFQECGEGLAELALSKELLTIPINCAPLVLLVQILINEEECELALHIGCRLWMVFLWQSRWSLTILHKSLICSTRILKERSRVEVQAQSPCDQDPHFLAAPSLNEMINVTPTTLNLLDLLTKTIEKMK